MPTPRRWRSSPAACPNRRRASRTSCGNGAWLSSSTIAWRAASTMRSTRRSKNCRRPTAARTTTSPTSPNPVPRARRSRSTPSRTMPCCSRSRCWRGRATSCRSGRCRRSWSTTSACRWSGTLPRAARASRSPITCSPSISCRSPSAKCAISPSACSAPPSKAYASRSTARPCASRSRCWPTRATCLPRSSRRRARRCTTGRKPASTRTPRSTPWWRSASSSPAWCSRC